MYIEELCSRDEFIDNLRRHVAVVAIGASTVRGPGNRGVANAARACLEKLPPSQFSVTNREEFDAALNNATVKLLVKFPNNARENWGLARKCLNIFLRDAFYNVYLRDRFGLRQSETYFEVPLDSIVGDYLVKKFPNELPKWPGVKHLCPEISQNFQNAALKAADSKNIARVHLDTYLWSNGREQSP